MLDSDLVIVAYMTLCPHPLGYNRHGLKIAIDSVVVDRLPTLGFGFATLVLFFGLLLFKAKIWKRANLFFILWMKQSYPRFFLFHGFFSCFSLGFVFHKGFILPVVIGESLFWAMYLKRLRHYQSLLRSDCIGYLFFLKGLLNIGLSLEVALRYPFDGKTLLFRRVHRRFRMGKGETMIQQESYKEAESLIKELIFFQAASQQGLALLPIFESCLKLRKQNNLIKKRTDSIESSLLTQGLVGCLVPLVFVATLWLYHPGVIAEPRDILFLLSLALWMVSGVCVLAKQLAFFPSEVDA